MSKVVKTMELEAIRKEFAGVKDMVVMGVGKLDCTADQQFRANLRKNGSCETNQEQHGAQGIG